MRYVQKLSVPFEYPVIFTRDLFAPENNTLADILPHKARPARAVVFVEEGLLQAWPELPQRIAGWAAAHPHVLTLAIPPMTAMGGEPAKNDLLFVQRIIHQLQRAELCRHSYVFAVGGGAFLDAVGLAAAVFHRGVRLIRVPTTVLAQDDSAVGVKNAVNLDGVKNLIGTFAPPFAVLNDLLFLTSLPQRDWLSGLAEAFKVGIIKDIRLLELLEQLAPALVARDLDAMQQVVERSAVLHMDHIREGGDPFEFGSARPLDFGHWSAHKLEAMTRHELRHGEAVAIGLALDLACAVELRHITAAERDRVCAAMTACSLQLYHPALTKRNAAGTLQVVAGLEEFRQHLGGELTLTMPDGLGRKLQISQLPEKIIETGVRWLAARYAAVEPTAAPH